MRGFVFEMMSGNLVNMKYLINQGVNLNAISHEGWNAYDYGNKYKAIKLIGLNHQLNIILKQCRY